MPTRRCQRADERVAALGPFQPDGAGNRVGQRWKAVETGPQRRDRLVFFGFEIAGAGVPGLDLKSLAGADAKEGLVFPVEGILARQLDPDEIVPRDLGRGVGQE